MIRRRTALALRIMAVVALLGSTACDDNRVSQRASQPAPTAPASSAAVASPGPSATRSPSAPTSPSSGPASPKPSSSGVARTAEDGFVVRPPGSGHGPAATELFTGGTAVALTFDDGPDPVNTPAILKVLRDNGVKATFCMVGFRVRNHPELVRQIAADGHTLCNHSWQHLINLAKKDPAYIDWDLRHTNEMIRAAVGADVPIKYFRAPGGNFTPELVAKARELGMASIYWDVDPRDWDHKPDADHAAHIQRVIREVKQHVREGSIVLSHDNGQPDTIVAYRTLVPWLKRYFTLEALPT
ncbi:polysaccharide deacetylase family protein [Dactylosporangium fulvum]|uniref:Polysaccharide deacetylase family protein n=1 Tax=Dactylosporangium fulvum TaxID=53359 RepID=A0ABY5VMU3_9ACTN|nr:polysaccharide deacetylase family protein [Dactylosporangium fulvum]UWP78745.1 polysaccharide deacetylase family protein [Dactylosporangium fulvum]